MAEDLTGCQLGHYRVDGVLGRGGMSVLYRATDLRLGRGVALKVLGEHLTGDAEFRARFADEARNTSAVDHANVVPLYDFGEIDGLLYIALRLVDGADLAGLLADGPISARRALDLLGQIAEALDLLHERGLVHLDLKPANVLVTSRESAGGGPAGGSAAGGSAASGDAGGSSGGEHAYLADFGLTRRGATGHRDTGGDCDDCGNCGNCGDCGDFLGSPNYAAPEHLRGEPVDGRTDQYALACVLFACLAGRAPFPGAVPDVVQGHLHREPPAVTSLVVLPRAVDEVLRRGMAKRPDERFVDCRSLVAAARDALATVVRPASGPTSGADSGIASGGVPAAPPHPSAAAPRTSAGRGPLPPAPSFPQSAGFPESAGSPQPAEYPESAEFPESAGFPQSAEFPESAGFPQSAGFPRAAGSFRHPQDEPVRLRPPMPAEPSSFDPSSFPLTGSQRAARWLVPLLVLAVLGGVIAAVVFLSGVARGLPRP